MNNQNVRPRSTAGKSPCGDISLMRAVALDVLARIVAKPRRAGDEEPDAFRALARYVRRALDLRISAEMPLLAGNFSLTDDEVMALRQEATYLIQQ